MLLTLVIFIVILGLLVFVHEFGHFVAAKRSGMKVEEFGFGFPPRMFGFQKTSNGWKFVWGSKDPSYSDETVYSVNWIPLGGFVKILGENNEHEEDARSFINRPFGGRFVTLVAGVVMNVILAWVLISVGYVVGLPTGVAEGQSLPHGATLTKPQAVIEDVQPGSPAFKAGLMAGDVIISVDNQNMNSIEQVHTYVTAHSGQTFHFVIKRIDQVESFDVESIKNPGPDSGPTGIVLADVGILKFPFYLAPWEGAKATVYQTGAIAGGLYQLITGKLGFSSVGGPVKIAQLTGQVAKLGFNYLLQFTAFLSINLALLNILPVPALDGGRVLFLLIEKVRRRRNNQKIEQWVNTVGFVLLLFLMFLVTVKDVRNFGGLGHILSKLIGK